GPPRPSGGRAVPRKAGASPGPVPVVPEADRGVPVAVSPPGRGECGPPPFDGPGPGPVPTVPEAGPVAQVAVPAVPLSVSVPGREVVGAGASGGRGPGPVSSGPEVDPGVPVAVSPPGRGECGPPPFDGPGPGPVPTVPEAGPVPPVAARAVSPAVPVPDAVPGPGAALAEVPTALADGPVPAPRGPGGGQRDGGGAPPLMPLARAPWEPPDDPPLRHAPERPAVPLGPAAPRTGPDSPAPARAAAHPGHVGDGPPTYEPEPTALPAATAENLARITPDTALDGARCGSGVLRAASIRGDSARYRGEPRRDALLTVRFGRGPTALVLVATASGARAAEGSHLAAADLCRWIGGAVGRSHARLAEDIRADRRGDLRAGLHRLTDRGFGRLRSTAAESGAESGEHPAGLRCLLIPADPECRTRVFFGAGPGGLFRLRDGAWQDLEPPHPAAGEPAGEQPEPPGPPFRFLAPVARSGDTLLLCGPGFADPLRGEPALAAELAARWATPAGPPGLAAFLTDVGLRVKGYADDRTAAALWES
ncbi:protein phosphatase 2C domain-containing protein, partial [Streptomyces clavuligerus]